MGRDWSLHGWIKHLDRTSLVSVSPLFSPFCFVYLYVGYHCFLKRIGSVMIERLLAAPTFHSNDLESKNKTLRTCKSYPVEGLGMILPGWCALFSPFHGLSQPMKMREMPRLATYPVLWLVSRRVPVRTPGNSFPGEWEAGSNQSSPRNMSPLERPSPM